MLVVWYLKMKKINCRKIGKEAMMSIKKTLDGKEWSIEKIGLVLVIFAMPMGPLALATYFTIKYLRKK